MGGGLCVFHRIYDLLTKLPCFGFYDACRYFSDYQHGEGVCIGFRLQLMFSRIEVSLLSIPFHPCKFVRFYLTVTFHLRQIPSTYIVWSSCGKGTQQSSLKDLEVLTLIGSLGGRHFI